MAPQIAHKLEQARPEATLLKMAAGAENSIDANPYVSFDAPL